jgi:hypothetical protein
MRINMNYRILIIQSIICSTAMLMSCGGKPLFTELATNRLKVKLLGTYESGGGTVKPWASPVGNLIDYNSVSVCGTDDSNDSLEDLPSKMMLDIAEIRLGSRSKAWAKFANYRQTYVVSINDSDPFFSGEGIELINDDPGNDNFTYVWLYVRKIIFNGAKRYNASCGELTDQVPYSYFREEKVNGLDWNQMQVRSHWDSLRLEGSERNRVFPVKIPISGGMKYNSEDGETVLEIRFVVKNFLKRYELTAGSSSDYSYDRIRYFGFSDWLRDVQSGDTEMGGNMLSIARSYVPEKSGSISSNTTGAGYIIAVRDDPVNIIDDYTRAVDNPRAHDCNFPVAPKLIVGTPDGLLEYFLRLEVYKDAWNVIQGTCGTTELYKTYWDAYNAAVGGFKLPELAVYAAAAGSHTIENVPAGTYRIYKSSDPDYGNLFLENAFELRTDPCAVAAGVESTCDFL